MKVEIFSTQLPNDTVNPKKALQRRDEIIKEFQKMINEYASARSGVTITWLQSSGTFHYGGAFTQLTAVVQYE